MATQQFLFFLKLSNTKNKINKEVQKQKEKKRSKQTHSRLALCLGREVILKKSNRIVHTIFYAKFSDNGYKNTCTVHNPQ